MLHPRRNRASSLDASGARNRVSTNFYVESRINIRRNPVSKLAGFMRLGYDRQLYTQVDRLAHEHLRVRTLTPKNIIVMKRSTISTFNQFHSVAPVDLLHVNLNLFFLCSRQLFTCKIRLNRYFSVPAID